MKRVFGRGPGGLHSWCCFCSVTLLCPLPEAHEFLLLCTSPERLYSFLGSTERNFGHEFMVNPYSIQHYQAQDKLGFYFK